MFEEVEEQSEEPKGKLYKASFVDDARCAHVFKRVSPYQVSCKLCHAGYYDSPDSPFPIEELNMYYALPEVKKYNQWL